MKSNVRRASAGLANAAKAEEIRTFFSKTSVPEAERTLQPTLERVASCGRFADAQRPKLDSWFAAR